MWALSQRGLHANLHLSFLMVTLYCLNRDHRDKQEEAGVRKHMIIPLLGSVLEGSKDKLYGIVRKPLPPPLSSSFTCLQRLCFILFQVLQKHFILYSCIISTFFLFVPPRSNKSKTRQTCTSPTCPCLWTSRNWRTCWSTLARSYPHASYGTRMEAVEE